MVFHEAIRRLKKFSRDLEDIKKLNHPWEWKILRWGEKITWDRTDNTFYIAEEKISELKLYQQNYLK
jgi:hypothetical protein